MELDSSPPQPAAAEIIHAGGSTEPDKQQQERNQYRASEGTTGLTRDALQRLVNISITGWQQEEAKTPEDFWSCSSCILINNLPIPTYGNSTPYFSTCPRSSRVWLLTDSTDPNGRSVTHKDG